MSGPGFVWEDSLSSKEFLERKLLFFDIYQIQVAAAEEITRVKDWDPDSVQSSSVHLCMPPCYSHRPCSGPQSHTEMEAVYPQRIIDCKQF